MCPISVSKEHGKGQLDGSHFSLHDGFSPASLLSCQGAQSGFSF